MNLRKGYIPGFGYALGGLCALAWVATCPAADAVWTVDGGEGFYEVRDNISRTASSRDEPTAADGLKEDRFQLVTADAASVDFVRPIRPAAVIDELQLGVEVFSTREGVRLIAEVVLPHARDRRSGAPLRAIVFGPMYSAPGRWQRLELAGFPLHVQRCVRTMQLSAPEAIDARGAYVDLVRLRIRPGRGETFLRLRDVRVRGAVPVDHTDGSPASAIHGSVRLVSGELLPGSGTNANRDEPPRVELVGGILHVEGTPLFPRAIDYFGGQLRESRGLGCNVVVLPSVPTRAQEREAEAADVWLIAPPPNPQALAQAGTMAAFPRVIAWHLGRRLTTVDVDATRQWAALVRRLDPARTRPLVASVSHDHRALSRVLDIVVIERQPLGGAVPLDEFVRQLGAEQRLVLPGKPVWMWIQTQLPPEVLHQARCLVPGNPPAVDARLPADEISRLVWIAVAHGASGLIFGGPPSGAANGEGQSARLELQLINHQLDLLRGVLVGTGTTRRIAELSPGLHGGVLSSGRTHCVLPWSLGGVEEPAVRPSGATGPAVNAPAAQISFVVPGVAEPSDAYLLATSGATRLTATREAGGVRVATGPLLPRDVVLLTQDALAAQRLRAAATARAQQMAAQEWNLLGLGAAVGTTAAHNLARLREVRLALADSRQEGSSGGASFRSSPLDRFPALSEPAQFYHLLDRRPLPTPNLLPGGDFEGLDATRQAGWRHVQLVHREPLHKVELVAENAYSGAFCLRMGSGAASDGDAAGEVIPSAWLTSPAVPLNAGDVIRVSGWIRGEAPQEDGRPPRAVIDDSLGGEPLALDIRPTPQWQPFVLYRGTDRHHEWVLRLACSGSGAIFFDRLVVHRIPREGW